MMDCQEDLSWQPHLSIANQVVVCFSLGDYKLDGIGPVDNRPSTDYLNHFVKKKLDVTPDT